MPLHIPAARRAVIAPDLARYLDPRNVDLMVTDQVQAVKVRVERGLEVFGARLEDARAAVRRWLTLGATLLPICVVAGYLAGRVLAGEDGGFRHGTVAVLAAGGALWAGSTLVGAGLDLRRLRRLSGRFNPGDLVALETSREVLEYGETILEAARELGAVPRTDSHT